MTDPMSQRAARGLGIAAILLGGILLVSTGCGSVTAKKSDGGGTGGSVVDSSTRMDVAADRKSEDARAVDASSHGGSGGTGAGGGAGGSGGGVGGSGGGVGWRRRWR